MQPSRILILRLVPVLVCMSIGAWLSFCAVQARVLDPGLEWTWRGKPLIWRQHGAGHVRALRPGRSGRGCLSVTNPDWQHSTGIRQTIRRVEPGTEYRLRVYGKHGDSPAGVVRTSAKLQFWGADWEPLDKAYASAQIQPAQGWVPLDVILTAPPRARQASVLLRVFGGGTALLDDVSLQRRRGAGVFVLVGRHQLQAGRATALPVPLWFCRAPKSAAEIDWRLEDGEGRRVAKGAAPLADRSRQEAKLSVSLPRLAPGGYQVLGVAGWFPPAALREFQVQVVVPLPAAARPPTGVRKGVFLDESGNPFFPLGLYHVPPEHYGLVARQGINCVQGVWMDKSEDECGEAIDAAYRAGLKTMVCLYGGGDEKLWERSRQRVRRFDNHPGTFSFKITDEPGASHEWRVAARYADLKRLNPKRPLLLTVCRPELHARYAQWCDAMQVDPYPLPDQPLTTVSAWCGSAHKVLASWQPLEAVLQAGWRNYPDDPPNQPTPEQAREMVHMAIDNGARGIWWYTFRHPGWETTWSLEKTELWKEFSGLNRRTSTMLNVAGR